jgi:hypothetical protein
MKNGTKSYSDRRLSSNDASLLQMNNRPPLDPKRYVQWIFVCFLVAVNLPGVQADSPSQLVTPGTVIAHSSASTGLFLGSPSLAIMSDGTYVASYDTFGPQSTADTVSIAVSHDKGASWLTRPDVIGQYWSSLFSVGNVLYLFGTDRAMGVPVLRRSIDDGMTWSVPNDTSTGRFSYTGRYITAPVPVIVDNGRIWRCFESVESGDLKEVVLSAPSHTDILDTKNWTQTSHLGSSRSWLDGTFLSWEEGNIVQTESGGVAAVLRVNATKGEEKVAVITVAADGRSLIFNPATDFVNFPGGGKKFTIRYDRQTNLYWTLTNAVPEAGENRNLERVRNTLALMSSPDLHNWKIQKILLYHPDVARHGFQYADWQFDQNDIVAVIRMAFDDKDGGARSQHDSNYIAFVRFASFRDASAGSINR